MHKEYSVVDDLEKSALDIARDRLLFAAFNWGKPSTFFTGEQIQIPLLQFRLPLENNTHSDFKHFHISNDDEAHRFIFLNLLSDKRLQILDSSGQRISFEMFEARVNSHKNISEAVSDVVKNFTAAISTSELLKIQQELSEHDAAVEDSFNSLFIGKKTMV